MKILRQFIQAALLTVLAVLFGLNVAFAQKEVKTGERNEALIAC